MTMWTWRKWAAAPCLALLLFFHWAATSQAYVLIADRPQNRVLKYSDAGAFLNVVVSDAANLGGSGQASGPNSLVLSSDGTKLYVGSLNNSVVRYDFNGTTATNPTKYISDGASSLADPGGLLFSQDGSTLFVSNRGFGFANTIARINPNGVSLGASLSGEASIGRTGMAFDPGGNLLVGGFGTDFNPMSGGATGGAVYRFNSGSSTFTPLVAQSNAYAGVSGLLVRNNDLYVVASVSTDFQGRIGKFNSTTGAIDGSFGTGGLITPVVSFPATITGQADGSGFLVGLLHASDTGSGRIDRYSYNGTTTSIWANNSFNNPALGFAEPTALLTVVIPEPATISGALVFAGAFALRRTTSAQRSR